jgi:hypothetical protein
LLLWTQTTTTTAVIDNGHHDTKDRPLLPRLSELLYSKKHAISIVPIACLSILAQLSLFVTLRNVSVVAVLVLSELVGPFAHFARLLLLAPSSSLSSADANNHGPSSSAATSATIGWPLAAALWALILGAGIFAAGDQSYSASGYAWLVLHVSLASLCQAWGADAHENGGGGQHVSLRHLAYVRSVLSLPFAVLVTAYSTATWGGISPTTATAPRNAAAALASPGGIAIVCASAVCGGALDVGLLSWFSSSSSLTHRSQSHAGAASATATSTATAAALLAVGWLSETFMQRSIGPISLVGAVLVFCLSRGVLCGNGSSSSRSFLNGPPPPSQLPSDALGLIKTRAPLKKRFLDGGGGNAGSALSNASVLILLTTVFCAWLWALPILAREVGGLGSSVIGGVAGTGGGSLGVDYYAQDEWHALVDLDGRGARAGAAAALPGLSLFGPASSSPAAALLAKPVAMRAVVMTGGTRIGSLRRLLYSLALLINDGDRIDTDVWIDVPPPPAAEGGEASTAAAAAAAATAAILAERHALKADIEQLGKNGTYRHGLIRAHVWDKHMGLRGQWLDAWDASLRVAQGQGDRQGGGGNQGPSSKGLTEATTEIGLILEDDLELSPYAWRWLKAAHGRYGADKRIAGFTLQRAQLCAASDCHKDLNGGPDGGGGGYFYPLIGTWGYSPTAKSYARFRQWYYSLPPDYKPYVDGLLPTEWYKSFEKAGTEKKRMWEMHHLKYTDTHEDKYTVYVKCPENYTLAVNHRELGLNYHTKEESPHTMLIDWAPELLRFSDNPLVLNYRAEIVGGERLASSTS